MDRKPLPSSRFNQHKLNKPTQELLGLERSERTGATLKNPKSVGDMISHLPDTYDGVRLERDTWKFKYRNLLRKYNILMDEHNDLLDLNAHFCSDDYHAPHYETYDSDGEGVPEETDVEISNAKDLAPLGLTSTAESTEKFKFTISSSTSTPSPKNSHKTSSKRKRSDSISSTTSIQLDSKLVAMPTNSKSKSKSKTTTKSKSASTPNSKQKPIAKADSSPLAGNGATTAAEKPKEKHHCYLTLEELLAIRPSAGNRDRNRFVTVKQGDKPRFEVTHEEFVAILRNRELARGKVARKEKMEVIETSEKIAGSEKAETKSKKKGKKTEDKVDLDGGDVAESVDKDVKRASKKQKLSEE